jgi:formamidopyrimidine-DNA glycosylase
MPELPDVELFKRVGERCRGRTIERAVVGDPGLLNGIAAAALERRLRGRRIEGAQRHGKHLFILLGEAGALALHFGTNGSLRLVAEGEAEPPYTRLELRLSGGERLAYLNPRRIGGISLSASRAAFVAAAKLGPDALDPAFDLPAFAALLRRSKRDVKSVLMDQALLAGIGNIYSDEILFQARIFPGTAAKSLDDRAASRLFGAMRETLATAIRCEIGSEQFLTAVPKDFLLSERRQGGHCPRCGAALATVKHGARTGYYCPRCQPH